MSGPTPPSPAPDGTLDSIGTAGVLRRRNGYRFTLDAVLLAHFAATEGGSTPGPMLELGAGSGVVSFLLVKQFGLRPVDALESRYAVRVLQAVRFSTIDPAAPLVLSCLA